MKFGAVIFLLVLQIACCTEAQPITFPPFTLPEEFVRNLMSEAEGPVVETSVGIVSACNYLFAI